MKQIHDLKQILSSFPGPQAQDQASTPGSRASDDLQQIL